MQYEIEDGLFAVSFEGELLAEATTGRELPRDRSWRDLNVREKRGFGRWVEMSLYKVAPDQDDPADMIQLPEGGYFFHVRGQSLVYHMHDSTCRHGVPRKAEDTEVDVVPCWDCRPPYLWRWAGPVSDPDGGSAQLLVVPDLIVDLESPRNTLFREATPARIVARIVNRQLSAPAQRLLEKAMAADPAIGEVFHRSA